MTLVSLSGGPWDESKLIMNKEQKRTGMADALWVKGSISKWSRAGAGPDLVRPLMAPVRSLHFTWSGKSGGDWVEKWWYFIPLIWRLPVAAVWKTDHKEASIRGRKSWCWSTQRLKHWTRLVAATTQQCQVLKIIGKLSPKDLHNGFN